MMSGIGADWMQRARAAGLERALADFPGDVEAAAESASTAVAKLVPPGDKRAEPWPPMRLGTEL